MTDLALTPPASFTLPAFVGANRTHTAPIEAEDSAVERIDDGRQSAHPLARNDDQIVQADHEWHLPLPDPRSGGRLPA